MYVGTVVKLQERWSSEKRGALGALARRNRQYKLACSPTLRAIRRRLRLCAIAYTRFLWTAIYGLSLNGNKLGVSSVGRRRCRRCSRGCARAREDRWDSSHIKLPRLLEWNIVCKTHEALEWRAAGPGQPTDNGSDTRSINRRPSRAFALLVTRLIRKSGRSKKFYDVPKEIPSAVTTECDETVSRWISMEDWMFGWINRKVGNLGGRFCVEWFIYSLVPARFLWIFFHRLCKDLNLLATA